ncbi:MAG: AAA family ATPase [Trebonia sp.]
MAWAFAGRNEQLRQVSRVLDGAAAGPVVLTGKPGMGRTALIERAVSQADPARRRIIQLRSGGREPLSSLRASFPGALEASVAADEAAMTLARRFAGPTALVADDAHLMDEASLLAMRALSRSGAASILVSCPEREPESEQDQRTPRPDPTGCLRYERGTRTILLPPLAVPDVAEVTGGLLGGPVWEPTAEALHAASGGNPRILRGLLTDGGLTGLMAKWQGAWRIAGAGGELSVSVTGVTVTGRASGLLADTAALTDRIEASWQELATERLDQLCRIALRCGARREAALIWPFLLLLGGDPEAAAQFLDALGADAITELPQLALARAMIVAFGFGQPESAARLLLTAAETGTGQPGLLAAYRAWLLSVTGCEPQAARALGAIQYTEREAALFVHATRANLTRHDGNARETVFHLRRALATAESCRGTVPWMWPYLGACLADALVLAGRGEEVQSAARWSRTSASARYVGDILRALILCRPPRVPAIPA